VKGLVVLGSTGSIGVNTLNVVREFPDRFRILALVAGRNIELVEQQAREFRPEVVAVSDPDDAARLSERLGSLTRVISGADALVTAATHPGCEIVVSAIVGAVGLRPTYAALEEGRVVALANKEALVVAGARMTECAQRNGGTILPVDSEHNALHQCLRGEKISEVRQLWLTASGGPFRGHSREALESVTVEQALAHPTWKMGPKITIDSATLMNKGLEVIEASWLFGVGPERIRVVVHPKSVVHSMVEFADGSFKAQLGVTDMRHPIQYALTWPDRADSTLPPFDPIAAGPLTFEAPDPERFPCLALAYRALEIGGAAPAVLNAANEVAVEAFLSRKTGFSGIPSIVQGVLDRHGADRADGIDDLMAADRRARQTARALLKQGVRS